MFLQGLPVATVTVRHNNDCILFSNNSCFIWYHNIANTWYSVVVPILLVRASLGSDETGSRPTFNLQAFRPFVFVMEIRVLTIAIWLDEFQLWQYFHIWKLFYGSQCLSAFKYDICLIHYLWVIWKHLSRMQRKCNNISLSPHVACVGLIRSRYF